MYKQISYIIAYYYFFIITVLRHTYILSLRHYDEALNDNSLSVQIYL